MVNEVDILRSFNSWHTYLQSVRKQPTLSSCQRTIRVKWFVRSEMVLSRVPPLRRRNCWAAVEFLSRCAPTIFPQLRCKPSVTSPKVHDAKVRHADCGSRMFCDFFRSGAKKIVRQAGFCYNVTVLQFQK